MRLRFLGQTYLQSNCEVSTDYTNYTARFLGQTYTPRLPVKPIKSQLGLRKYRGISYKS